MRYSCTLVSDILHATARQNATQVLRDAATAYKVDVEAIGLKVRQELSRS